MAFVVAVHVDIDTCVQVAEPGSEQGISLDGSAKGRQVRHAFADRRLPPKFSAHSARPPEVPVYNRYINPPLEH
jgi:hypothetical protein